MNSRFEITTRMINVLLTYNGLRSNYLYRKAKIDKTKPKKTIAKTKSNCPRQIKKFGARTHNTMSTEHIRINRAQARRIEQKSVSIKQPVSVEANAMFRAAIVNIQSKAAASLAIDDMG